MITVDIVVGYSDGWVEVPLTGSKMVVAVKSYDGVLIRFGSSSVSSGFKVGEGTVLVLDETVWIKDSMSGGTAIVAVTQ